METLTRAGRKLLATSDMVPSTPTVMCAVSLEANEMRDEAVKPRLDAKLTTSAMDVPSLKAVFTCNRLVAPTAPEMVMGEAVVETDVTVAAASRTVTVRDADRDDAKFPTMFVAPEDAPMTTLPATVATAVALEEKVVTPVTSYTVASVRSTTALALKRWYVVVQPMRLIVALGDVESDRFDASTMGTVRVASMDDAAAYDG